MITAGDHQSYHNLGENVEPRVIIWKQSSPLDSPEIGRLFATYFGT